MRPRLKAGAAGRLKRQRKRELRQVSQAQAAALAASWGPEDPQLRAAWQQACRLVESYPGPPQPQGAQADYLRLQQGRLSVVYLGGIAAGCARFRERACPRMIPMGHEYAHETCNYWDWKGFSQALPGFELYPEWQRFDCHKYYALMALSLVGLECAQSLGAEFRLLWMTDKVEDAKALSVFKSLARPGLNLQWKDWREEEQRGFSDL